MDKNARISLKSTLAQQENQPQYAKVKPTESSGRRFALNDLSNQQQSKQLTCNAEVPPSPNMAKRPRSVSMEILSANDKKARATSIPARDPQENLHPAFVHRIFWDHTVKPDLELYMEDESDPQMCEEYADDIYAYMYETQERFMVNPQYIMEMPADHRWPRNRNTLFNWLLTVHRKFHLVGETFFLATSLIDQFLSNEVAQARNANDVLGLDSVQLLASSCLFIAAKYEEVMTPAINNFSFIANCEDQQIRDMEKRVLISLNFDLGLPCPLNFLRRISKADDYDLRSRTVAKFLLDLIVFEPRLMVYRPSDVAAGAMYISIQMISEQSVAAMNPRLWNNNFVYYSNGCTAESLIPIVGIILDYLRGPCDQRDLEFIRKYMSRKQLKSSVWAIKWARGEPLEL